VGEEDKEDEEMEFFCDTSFACLLKKPVKFQSRALSPCHQTTIHVISLSSVVYRGEAAADKCPRPLAHYERSTFFYFLWGRIGATSVCARRGSTKAAVYERAALSALSLM
jgi:hypothetical protein